jgi:hypothetical protein
MVDVAEAAVPAPAGPPGAGPPVVPDFQIVPVRGLPIVGAVIVALVVVIAGDWRWGLDFFHVAGGGMWTAIDLFVGFIIGPILARLTVQARVEFSTRFMPKMLLLMPTLVIVTLTAGWQLAHKIGTLDPSYPRHGWLVASYFVVGVMAVIALGLLEPVNLAVLFELKKPRPNPEIIARLMRRFIYTAAITGAMQVATLIIMTRIAS